MNTVRIENGYANVRNEEGIDVVCMLIDGLYHLDIKFHNGRVSIRESIVNGCKRLSTVNRHASRYGIEFIEG